MKLYLVTSNDYGSPRRAVVGGSHRFPHTVKAEAERRFKFEQNRLRKSGHSFDLAFFQVTTPNHVDSVMWMEYLASGDISAIELKILERDSHRAEAAA